MSLPLSPPSPPRSQRATVATDHVADFLESDNPPASLMSRREEGSGPCQKNRKKQRVSAEVPFDDSNHSHDNKECLAVSLSALLRNEQHYTVPRDYLVIPADVVIDRDILLVSVDDTCREQMIDWAHELMEFCGFDSDPVAIAVNILDRYVYELGALLQDRNHYQLLTMTCLYIALKIHERVVLSSRQLADLSRGKFSHSQIEELEVKICMALEWRLNPPTLWQYFHLLTGYYLSVEERKSLAQELFVPFQRATASCTNMKTRASVLFCSIVDPVLRRVLEPIRCEEVTMEWHKMLYLEEDRDSGEDLGAFVSFGQGPAFPSDGSTKRVFRFAPG